MSLRVHLHGTKVRHRGMGTNVSLVCCDWFCTKASLPDPDPPPPPTAHPTPTPEVFPILFFSTDVLTLAVRVCAGRRACRARCAVTGSVSTTRAACCAGNPVTVSAATNRVGRRCQTATIPVSGCAGKRVRLCAESATPRSLLYSISSLLIHPHQNKNII